MYISEIIREIESFAPLSLQEDYDNSGLQIGDIHRSASGILISLDITEEVIDEAIERNCNLIISHHPLIFKPLKSLTGKTYVERCIIKACKNDLVIYAAHTNLDNTCLGVNYPIAEKIGLHSIRILSPQEGKLIKLVTFVPESHVEIVRNSLFEVGAGHIGNYDCCSFNSKGEGSFRAGQDTHPYSGKKGELYVTPEIRLEIISPAYKKNEVIRTLLASHPYEEPAFDIYFLANTWNQTGAGLIGELSAPEAEQDFLQRLKTIFHIESIKHSKYTGKPIKKVAICGGSGAFLIPEAITNGADILITGEVKYNDFYDVEKKMLLAVIGHYESEVCTKELILDLISKKFPNFAVHFSISNTNPVYYL